MMAMLGWFSEAKDLCLTLKTCEPVGIEREPCRQHLEGHLAVQLGIAGAIHLTHAPGADQPEDFIGAKASAGLEGHSPPELYVQC